MNRFYASGEYLLWWIRSPGLPVLVTSTTQPQSLGVLGEPGTVVLFGGTRIDPEERSGGRFRLGWWCDPCQILGIEGDYLFLGQRSVRFAMSSLGQPILARPFLNIVSGEEDAQLVASPALPNFPQLIPLTGRVNINLSSRLSGAEANVRHNVGAGTTCCGWSYRADLLGGFRYLELNEGLAITEMLNVPLAAPQAGGAAFVVSDQFGTHNRFYGGQLGVQNELRWGRWSLNARGKVALGGTQQIVTIGGSTVFTAPGRPAMLSPGGLLALPTNMGRYHRDMFSVVPEVGVNLGCQITDCLQAYVGYTLVYWGDVARPGDQIDRAVNPTQLPRFNGAGQLVGPPRPAFAFKDTDFWAQGVNFGLEIRY